MKKIKLLVFLVNQIVDASICYNRQTEQNECCQDYRNVSGKCEACIGSWGKTCQRNCSYGFYGHGCRNKCDCNLQQICDRRQGCVVEKSIYNVTATTPMNVTDIQFIVLEILCLFLVVIVFLLVWRGFLYFYRKMNNSENTNRTSQEINTEITVAEQPDDEDSVYSDVRESTLIASVGSRESYTLLRHDMSGPAMLVSEQPRPDDGESVYSDVRESTLIASVGSRESYTLLRHDMSGPAMLVSEQPYNEESVYSDIRESKLIDAGGSHESSYTLRWRDMSGPAMLVSEQPYDEESVYSDVRESKLIASVGSRESSYTLLRQDMSGPAMLVSEEPYDEESVYSDVRESKLIDAGGSRESSYTLRELDMSGPVISNPKSFPFKIRGGKGYALTEMDYNRLQLKVQPTLQGNRMTYSYCSHEMYNQYQDFTIPSSNNGKEEFREDPECVDPIENYYLNRGNMTVARTVLHRTTGNDC